MRTLRALSRRGDGFGSRERVTRIVANSERALRRRDVNPRLGGDQMQDKTDPECSAEEFTRRQAGEAAPCKEEPDDGTNRGHRKTNRKGPDHPLAVPRDFSPVDMPEGLAQSE